ncbi:MAG: MinD/ParA family protein [Gammaproteobacteria bacterium]|nr:MinD/ParA family protein [Gammaproteobacteria bacterium]
MLVSETVDQASGLRQAARSKPVRVIAVTSGKGGVGKTNIAVNLGVCLSSMGKEVMLMDADLGLANVDVMLGLHPKLNLSHVIKGECSLEEVVVIGPEGLRIVPASSGLQAMVELAPAEHVGIIHAFSEFSIPLDFLIIDTAAGLSDSVVSYTKAAQEVIIVLCDEPASITDAYALIKLLSREYGLHRFRVLTNMVPDIQAGRSLFQKIVKVTDRYLDVALDFIGVIPNDEYLRKAVQRQKAVSDAYPRCKSSLAFKKLAQKADSWPMPASAGGRLEFFIERLIMASQHGTGVSL